MPPSPPPHEEPPALRAGPGDSHTSPPGGRSAGLLRLGWSRANGWAPRGPRPPRCGACGPSTLSSPNAPAPRPARTSAPQPPGRRGPQGLLSSTRSTTRRENKGEEFPGPRSAEDTLLRAAPPDARGRHFVPLEKKRTGRGGHFRALLAAAARHSPSPRTQQPPLQLPPQDPAVGDGEGGEGNGKQKRGREGGGRNRDRLEALSSEESPLRPPPGTRRRLHRAPTHRWRRGVSGAALITLGRRTRRGRPEWLRRHPISSRAAARRQSAQDAGGAAGKLGCGAARRSAQSRIREGCGPAGGVGQRARPACVESERPRRRRRRGRLLFLPSLFPAARRSATAPLPFHLVSPERGEDTRPPALPDSGAEPGFPGASLEPGCPSQPASRTGLPDEAWTR